MAKRTLILFDDQSWAGLLPLTWLRPVCELRIGVSTQRERWERLLDGLATPLTQDYLAGEFPIHVALDNFFINASLLPTPELVREIVGLDKGEALTKGDDLLAARLDRDAIERLSGDGGEVDTLPGYEYTAEVTLLRRPYDLFVHNAAVIAADLADLTAGRDSAPLSASNTVIGDHAVFLEEGARCEAAVLNVTQGPIYLGRDAEVMEGCLLRGPIAVCDGAVLKMGAKVYPGTTVGPHSKAGGEINNVVFQGNCNKGHDGYLGNAVIGQWCNLGADTNASNLKNNYADTRLWHYGTGRFEPTGLQFCGLIMGDHAKCGINTMFNTATVVGVGANVFGDGFPRTFVPDFSWGGAGGQTTYQLDKMIETVERVYARRATTLSTEGRASLRACFDLTAKHRPWELKSTAATPPTAP